MLYSRRRSICQTDCGRAYSEKSNLHLGPRTDHGGRTSFAPFGLGEVARWPKFLKDAKLSKRSGGAEPLKCDVHAFRFFFSRDLLAASPPRITQRREKPCTGFRSSAR